VEKGVWEGRVRKNADEKNLGSYHRSQRNVYTTKGRIYPLFKDEREEVQNFVEDQLRKGYIRPTKSPQTSPVFFIGKKDGKKRIVIDYHNLNSQTVKNNYLLPLITELINNIEGKKVFTKMDLR